MASRQILRRYEFSSSSPCRDGHTRLLEPFAVRTAEQRANSLFHILMIALKPGALGVRQLGPVDQQLVKGDERQRLELQPAFPTGMGRHVIIRHHHIEVLEADTAPALLVIARLIRHHHTGLERLVSSPWP